MKRIYYISFILILGFLLSPVNSYACKVSKEIKTESNCCHAKVDSTASQKINKHCCKETKSEKKSCNGSCSNSDCNVTPVFSSILPVLFFNLKENIFIFQDKILNFSYLEKQNSIPYFTVWSPPKIS